MRLRSYVLRERMRWGLWRGCHLPGTQLASDILTKAVTTAAAWKKFYGSMGMENMEHRKESSEKVSPKIAAVDLGTIVALGVVAGSPGRCF